MMAVPTATSTRTNPSLNRVGAAVRNTQVRPAALHLPMVAVVVWSVAPAEDVKCAQEEEALSGRRSVSVGLPPLAGRSGGRKGKRGGASGAGEPRWQVLPQEPAPGSLGSAPPGSSVVAAAAAALHAPAALPPGMALGPMQQMLLEGTPAADAPLAEGSAPMAAQFMKALSLEPSPSGSISPFAHAPAAQTSSEESDTESDEKQVRPSLLRAPWALPYAGCSLARSRPLSRAVPC